MTNYKLKPPEIMVDVNKHKIHVYKKGNGINTIVFMSGGGTCCPTIDFKPLWSILSTNYTIVVIEKAGYGWSETAKTSRNIDIILNETRLALSGANLYPPYILMPHSMSGLEALLWARKFPNEVLAIIGLDAAIPACYDYIKVNPFLFQLLWIYTRLGGFRLISNSIMKPIVSSGNFSHKEIKAYKHMFNHNSLTSNMIEEFKKCHDNAKRVLDVGFPKSTPFFPFISNGEGTGIDNWREILSNFALSFKDGGYLFLDCSHYVHMYEPRKIAKTTEKFIDALSNNKIS